jgi:ATP-dependent 26S proteasome regulatory subunit
MGGSSGAEVKGTCTEAGMYALRYGNMLMGLSTPPYLL